MSTTALMGIENEFEVTDNQGQAVDGKSIYDLLLSKVKIPYFKLGGTAVRLATGGSFYIDGKEPEVTSAPYPLEKEAVTALAVNLVMNRNVLAQAMQDINAENEKNGKNTYQLNGHSAHYNFTLPEISAERERGEGESTQYERRRDLCFLLARTVNPALQLLLENRKSSGIMFRYREDGRIEICADFVPHLEDMVSGIGFQTAMLTTIDTWFKKGATIEDITEKLQYLLPDMRVDVTTSRPGYTCKTPEVITVGREAMVNVSDPAGAKHTLSAQALLEHYANIFEGAMDAVLSEQEKKV
ncbi:MAG: hypothetical protein Q7K45_00935, partial [Nanoarchaeota archaeon]|nr:hypothetical protein [Nanoarchaeota archaeon]